jgi:hypothetical protein
MTMQPAGSSRYSTQLISGFDADDDNGNDNGDVNGNDHGNDDGDGGEANIENIPRALFKAETSLTFDLGPYWAKREREREKEKG